VAKLSYQAVLIECRSILLAVSLVGAVSNSWTSQAILAELGPGISIEEQHVTLELTSICLY
jgi:hypothetical protein